MPLGEEIPSFLILLTKAFSATDIIQGWCYTLISMNKQEAALDVLRNQTSQSSAAAST